MILGHYRTRFVFLFQFEFFFFFFFLLLCRIRVLTILADKYQFSLGTNCIYSFILIYITKLANWEEQSFHLVLQYTKQIMRATHDYFLMLSCLCRVQCSNTLNTWNSIHIYFTYYVLQKGAKGQMPYSPQLGLAGLQLNPICPSAIPSHHQLIQMLLCIGNNLVEHLGQALRSIGWTLKFIVRTT